MTYFVKAYNLSHASENKIHDDAVAKKLGFSGGLVPGVEVYAYACHMPVARWGRAWLERGRMDCRFLKPVYDGKTAVVTGSAAGSELTVSVESDGVLCATATAHAPVTSQLLGGEERAARTLPPSIGDYALRSPAANRPPADEASLAAGNAFGIRPFVLTEELADQYLRDVRETDQLYAREGLAHPGQLLRLANLILRENVVLQPWIHTGSKVTNFAPGRVGDELSARGRVTANYERKGHRLVDLDIVLIANGATVLAHVLHTAVYRLRQLAN
jgi:acyl dehydratase